MPGPAVVWKKADVLLRSAAKVRGDKAHGRCQRTGRVREMITANLHGGEAAVRPPWPNGRDHRDLRAPGSAAHRWRSRQVMGVSRAGLVDPQRCSQACSATAPGGAISIDQCCASAFQV